MIASNLRRGGEKMKNIRGFLGSSFGRATLAVATVAGVLVGGAVASGADVVSSAFGTETTSLTTDIGLGAALVVALMGIGLGVRMLIKWSKRSVSAA
jgi:hypothetical protein